MPKSRVAIVTAAGRGIGAEIARELHRNDYQLALMSPSGTAEKLAVDLGVLGVTGSVTKAADLERLVNETLSAYGRIDALVNNTGPVPKGELLEFSDQDWYQGLDLLLLNVIRMARLVTPVMVDQGGGTIVNISTFAALEPSLEISLSCVLRASLASFTKLHAERYAQDGIRVNAILPGYIDSLPHGQDRAAQIPLRRIGTVHEIARTTSFLLSDDAGYITGQNIRVDGGLGRHL